MPVEQVEQSELTPRELREIFPNNLRMLADRSESISALARDIGVHRTQLNRYLTGRSFPTPDVLFRICRHFRVDGRVLLEPLETIRPADHPVRHVAHAAGELLAHSSVGAPAEDYFPSGLYRVVQHSDFSKEYVTVLLGRIWRDIAGIARFRAFLGTDVFTAMALPLIKPIPQVRGVCLGVTEGVAIFASLMGTQHVGFAYLAPDPFGRPGRFQGSMMNAGPERGPDSTRRRIVLQQIPSLGAALNQRRQRKGVFHVSELPDEDRTIFEPLRRDGEAAMYET